MKKREAYLDLVLGKLPDIAESHRGGKGLKEAISERKSEASTAYKTEISTVNSK
jgi:hypothetical protein